MTEPPKAVSVDEQKRAAAHRAVEEYVRSGMVVGLGTGSTAIHATRRIGALLAGGELDGVVGVPTAIETADAARAAGIPLLGDDVPWSIDVTIDGADEVDPDLELIKGGGGALLREKLVAQASAFEVIVVDASKRSKVLGTSFALPVEVVDFGLATTIRGIERLGAKVVVRGGDTPFRTDQGNLVLDCDFGPIADPLDLSAVLHAHAGVVEHGLFLGLAHALVVAGPDGVEVIAKG
ncbi:MAG TPA: ribose-5-phosphate isomerase RpiA [Acidimicrobiia bacterium]|nr:ribose-5-phosphate isomerase RpiA [Acidimicrobiia bacterium]